MSNARNLSDIVGGNFDIPAGSLDNAVPANGSITTAKLADDAVTSAKIADDAVVSAALATDAVGSDALSSSAIGALDLPTGSILQIVSTTDNTRRKYSSVSNNTWLSNFNNIDTAITPLSASSKLMFFVNIHYGCDSGTGGGSIFWRIKEGGSVHSTLNGDSGQTHPSFSQDRWGHSDTDMQYHTRIASINGIQISNSTTTARTYSIEFKIQSASRDVSVNRDGSDSSDSNQGSHSPTLASNMTIIEVAP